jgi:hypothetical protein
MNFKKKEKTYVSISRVLPAHTHIYIFILKRALKKKNNL